jgi:hypothetical protein
VTKQVIYGVSAVLRSAFVGEYTPYCLVISLSNCGVAYCQSLRMKVRNERYFEIKTFLNTEPSDIVQLKYDSVTGPRIEKQRTACL